MQPLDHDVPHHGLENESFDEEDEVNPFYRDPSVTFDREVFPRRPNLRDHGTQSNYDVKVDIPTFEGKHHPDDFIDWLNTGQ